MFIDWLKSLRKNLRNTPRRPPRIRTAGEHLEIRELLSATPVIIDNGDPGYYDVRTWTESTTIGHASDQATASSTTAGALASWTFSNLDDGQYYLQATWALDSQNATNATFTARSEFGAAGRDFTVNQRLTPTPDDLVDGTPFKTLGVVTVRNGSLTVELTNRYADGNVVADAVRLEPVAATDNSVEVRTERLDAITKGLFAFQDVYGHLPPVATPLVMDANGKFPLSWRVHLLPFLGYDDLYRSFHLTEPWNSPHNLALLPQMPDVFRSLDLPAGSGLTGFQRIDVPGGFHLTGAGGPDLNLIQFDNPATSLLLLELAADKALPWTAPDDVPYSPLDPLASISPTPTGFILAAMADGKIQRLNRNISAADFHALVTWNGKEILSAARLADIFLPSTLTPDQISQNNLKSLYIGMANYHDSHGNFPPGPWQYGRTDYDSNKNPYLSWRVHLLPYIGEEALFKKFHLNEPWDSPHNLPLAEEMPAIFLSAGLAPGSPATGYQILNGLGAYKIQGDQGYSFNHITDGTSDTLAVIELPASSAKTWTRPDGDIPYNSADPLAGIAPIPADGLWSIMFDGSIRKISSQITPQNMAALASWAGGEVQGASELTNSFLNYPFPESIDDRRQKLNQIALAFQVYYDIYHLFPVSWGPRDRYDADGNPNLSWRVYLLPYLGYKKLFDQFHLDEPWNSPHNLTLLDQMPEVFRSRGLSVGTTLTGFQLLTGPDAFQHQGLRDDQITAYGPDLRFLSDDRRTTVLVLETQASNSVEWTRPDGDISFDLEDPLSGLDLSGLENAPADGLLALMTDGSVRNIRPTISAADFSAITTWKEGELIDANQDQQIFFDQYYADYHVGYWSESSLYTDLVKKTGIPLLDQYTIGRLRLKSIGLALHLYDGVYLQFPISNLPIFFEADGKPKLSWRVHLLPYLGEQNLYNQFHLDEPWDSPNNLPLLDKMPEIFLSRGLSAGTNLTGFQVIWSPDSYYSSPTHRPSIDGIHDGTAATFGVIETPPELAVPWSKPDDFPFDPVDPFATIRALVSDYLVAVMLDGSTNAFSPQILPSDAAALITWNGGEVVSGGAFTSYGTFEYGLLSLTPQIQLTDSAANRYRIETDVAQLGPTPLGSPLDTTFTIKNTGSQSLVISSIQLPTGFTLVTPLNPIAPNATASLTIRLDAAIGGNFGGLVVINSNVPDQPALRFTLNADVTSPLDLTLDNASIDENLSADSIVGTFSTTGPNPGSTFVYTLVNGTGATDNALFTIDASGQLHTTTPFNFENRPTYSIRVRTTEQGTGTSHEQSFTITVNDVIGEPAEIFLTGNSIPENSPVGAEVGTLTTTSPNSSDTFTYTFVNGTGATDNALFSLNGNQLLSAASFNFETKSSYSIRLRSTNQSGQWVEQVFSIAITNVNEAPLDLGYFGASKPENSPIGTQFGFFFGVDLDAGSFLSFALVEGPGGDDNDLFYFDGNLLRNSALLDYEQKSAYNIRVQVADQGGLFIEKPFVFTITNENEPPTEILLSNSEVLENSPSGTVVGNFTTFDQDSAGTFTYSLVSGTGSTDNASFTLINGVLRTAFVPDFEVKSSYSIRVRTTDSTGLSLTKVFTITITNFNDAPILNNNGNPTFDPITLNIPPSNNPGTLVTDIIARMSPKGGITDPDNDPLGIAVNGLTATANGTWQFTTDGGTTWIPFGPTGNANGRLLAADPLTRIRYVPNTGFIGEAKIAFAAWDQTSGTNGSTAAVGTRGGSTPYSANYDYASIFVRNNAPVLNNNGNPTLNTITLNIPDANNPGTLISDIIARMSPNGGITDQNPGALQGIAINGLTATANGTWEFTVNNGTNWTPIGTTGNSNARLLAADPNTRIRYRPNAGFLGEAKIAFVAWDRTTGANGGIANVASRGGSTPYSLNYEYASIFVVNIAPVLTPTGASYLDSIPENISNTANVGTLVSDLITRIGSNCITDQNPGALQGIAINGLTGTANGTWQYTINGGTSWSNINTTGNSNARLLAANADTRIRFVPNLNFTGTVKLAFVAWDQTAGINGGIASTSTRGNSTPFSTLYDYASLSVHQSLDVRIDSSELPEQRVVIATDADGKYAIVWVSSDGDSLGIFARLYNPAGIPRSEVFRVNSYTTNSQFSPAIAMNEAGDFVVAWESKGQDGGPNGIYSQRFDSMGIPQGAEFRVDLWTTYTQADPAVAMDRDGNFVVAWEGRDQSFGNINIFAQRYNASGIPQGVGFKVSTYRYSNKSNPSIAMNNSGNFVVVWQNGQGDTDYNIFAQRFNSVGDAQGGEFLVNSYYPGWQIDPVVGIDDEGDFVVAWRSYQARTEGVYGIFARRYDSAGAPKGFEFEVNSTGHRPGFLSVDMDSKGNFLVVFSDKMNDEGSDEIFGQRYNAVGELVGSLIQVNTYTTNSQWYPVTALDEHGDFVVAWYSQGGGDIGQGVYFRKFFDTPLPDNHAPVLQSDREIFLDTLLVGAPAELNTGISIAELIARMAPDGGVSDLDPQARRGIAINGNSNINGVWQYTVNAGIDWLPMITSGDEDALLLAVDQFTRIRFIPTPGFSGRSLISFVAWDRTGGVNGGTADVSVRGGTTPFSLESEFAMIDIHLPEETQVTLPSSSLPNFSSVAADHDGNFVIVWDADYRSGNLAGIYGRRFDAQGKPLGNEFRVDTYDSGQKTSPVVAVDPDGNFVVAWTRDNLNPGYFDIYARQFNSFGVPLGGEFKVNTYSTYDQQDPQIAIDDAGNFIIAWTSRLQDGSGSGIYAQRFDSLGTPQGLEFRANTFTTGNQINPAVAVNPEGDFVIAWSSENQEGKFTEVYAQRFTRSGTPLGTEFRVNTYLPDYQDNPAIGFDGSGNFIIAWKSYGQEGGLDNIYAQRYDANGLPQGTEFRVNSWTKDHQLLPAVAVSDSGEFMVSWTSFGQDGSGPGIFAQKFNSDGSRSGTEFQVNDYSIGTQNNSSIADLGNGEFVVAWTGFDLDNYYSDIFLRRSRPHDEPPNHAPFLNPNGNPSLNYVALNVSPNDNQGTLVSEILGRMAPGGGISDLDWEDLSGIAITALTGTATGTWQFTVNDGLNWTDFGSVSEFSAQLLAADSITRIRYNPADGFLGDVSVAFVAWDRTSGMNGMVSDVTERGGTSAFSSDIEQATLSVVLNTAPVLRPMDISWFDPIPRNVSESENTGTLVSDLIARMGPVGGITDQNLGALQGIAINGLTGTANGTWQYTINGGTSWSNINTTGNSNARLLAANADTRIRFVPNLNFTGTVKLAFVAWDQTAGINGGIANTSTRGGTTPFSTLYDYASLTIT